MRLLTGLIAAACLVLAEQANAQSCNLNGKQIIYQLRQCEMGSCQSGVEMLRVLGKKILAYRGPSASLGREFYIGKSIRIDGDPLLPPVEPGTELNTTVTATYENNVIHLSEENIYVTPNFPDRRMLGVTDIEILPRCTFCRVNEVSLVLTRVDGVILGQKRFDATSCYVSDIPSE